MTKCVTHVRKIISVLAIVLLLAENNYFWLNLTKKVEAASYTITKSIDFKNGYFDNTETDSKEGELKLKPDGAWGPRAFKTPDVTLSNQSGIVSDGENIYVLASNDNWFGRYLPKENRWQRLANAPKFAYYGAQLVYLNNYIYAVFGGYQREFYRY
jgi:hypothetical protein